MHITYTDSSENPRGFFVLFKNSYLNLGKKLVINWGQTSFITRHKSHPHNGCSEERGGRFASSHLTHAMVFSPHSAFILTLLLVLSFNRRER